MSTRINETNYIEIEIMSKFLILSWCIKTRSLKPIHENIHYWKEKYARNSYQLSRNFICVKATLWTNSIYVMAVRKRKQRFPCVKYLVFLHREKCWLILRLVISICIPHKFPITNLISPMPSGQLPISRDYHAVIKEKAYTRSEFQEISFVTIGEMKFLIWVPGIDIDVNIEIWGSAIFFFIWFCWYLNLRKHFISWIDF